MRACAAVLMVGAGMSSAVYAEQVALPASWTPTSLRTAGTGAQSKQGDAWKYLTTWAPAPTVGNSNGGLPDGGVVPAGTVGGSGNTGFAGTIDIPPGTAMPEIPGAGGEPRVELSHPAGSGPEGSTASIGGGVTSGMGTWMRPPGEVNQGDGMVPTQYSVVPIPPAALLGLAGLGGVGVSGWVRRRNR